MAEIVVHLDGLAELQRAIRDKPAKVSIQLDRAFRKGAVIVERFAKQEAPVDRGPLRASIRTSFGNLRSETSPHVDYAVSVHEGSRPHWPPIQAFTGRTESLDLWARRHGISPFAVARSIARKGTKPNKFMERATQLARYPVEQAFQQAVDNVVRD